MTRGNNLKAAAGVLLEIAQCHREPMADLALEAAVPARSGYRRMPLFVSKLMPSRKLAWRTGLKVEGAEVPYRHGEKVSLPGVSGGSWLVHSFKVLFEGLRICFFLPLEARSITDSFESPTFINVT